MTRFCFDLDAIGEYSSGLIGVVSQKKIKSFDKLNINNSLGLIYSAITVFCGFKFYQAV